MSIIRKGDRVLAREAWFRGEVRSVERGHVTLTSGLVVADDACTLLCGLTWSGVACDGEAAWFEPVKGKPVCDQHATAIEWTSPLMLTRPELAVLASCICGETLDDAPSKGIWTIGDVAAEYRDCHACGSTRAYIAKDRTDHPVMCARASHPHFGRDDPLFPGEWPSLLEAIDGRDGISEPMGIGEELMRNGITLARTFQAANGDIVWQLLPPEHE